MKEPTQTPPANTAKTPPSARHLYEEYRREAEGIPPEPLDPTRYHLKGEQLERPADVPHQDPEAADFLRHPERWPFTVGGVPMTHILRRRRHPSIRGACSCEYGLLVADDPNLSRAVELGWEAD
jgi:hypothetical protein